MALRVLTGGRAGVLDAYEPVPAFDLHIQPLRPGLAHEHLELVLSEQEAAVVKAVASTDGVPVGLWAAIAIESERALRVAAEATGAARPAIEAALDDASSEKPSLAFARQRGRRLAAYARELRGRRAGDHSDSRGCLTVPVGYHTLSAWEIEASRIGATLEQWQVELLMKAPTGRPQWEAAAAESGQTLGEWVAVEAARRFSSC